MEAEKVGVFNPAFAAFNASDVDQQAMGKRLTTLKEGTCYHGNAGIASAFAALGDKKLKLGGVVALVLPLSAASGLAWQSFRKMLETKYSDLTVVSISANGKDMSFSSDTGMAECLVIARKSEEPTDNLRPSLQSHSTSLRRRPQGFAEASVIAGYVSESKSRRKIEDGPYGGTMISIGDARVGEVLQSKLWLPGNLSSLELPTTVLDTPGKLGFYHLDINGPPPRHGALPRGPFTNGPPSPTATYPCLWSHTATRETRIVCEPDSQLSVRSSMEEKAATVWATASRSHLNRDFTFGSQPCQGRREGVPLRRRNRVPPAR